VVRFNAVTAEHLYRELTGQSSEWLADRLTHMVAAAGMPTSLRTCGVAESILPLLSHEANQQWTARFNPRTVDETAIQSIYRSAW
jgi:alcohol dehydrogenase